MGVDWIPCRVEEGYTREELSELVRREAMLFRAGGNSLATVFDPRLRFSETEREAFLRSYRELGPLHRCLLFKQPSHRISVITSESLFPVEWRINAERTILPWELSSQIELWQTYRSEVAQGKHQAFVRQLYIHEHVHELITVDLANLISFAAYSQTGTGAWSTRPEVVACRDQILNEEMVTLPPPPRWPEDADSAGDLTLPLLEDVFAKVRDIISTWNTAVQRGNKRVRLPIHPQSFDDWIAEHLGNKWYASFIDWVQPWEQGGYGLYRDCE